MRKMKLMTKALEAIAPGLHATEDVATDDKLIVAKIFDPCGRFTFYLVEYDPVERIAFGWTRSALGPDCDELGYASLDEMESVRNGFGLPLERDKFYKPNVHTIGEIRAEQTAAL